MKKGWLFFIFIFHTYSLSIIKKLKMQKKALNAILYRDTKLLKNINEQSKQALKEFKTEKNESLLHIAAGEGALKIVKILIKIGLNPKQTNKNGETPYNYALNSSHNRTAKYLQKKTECQTDGINLLTDYSQEILPYNLVKIRVQIKNAKNTIA